MSGSLIFLIPVRSIKIYIKSISSLYLIFPILLLPAWQQVMVFTQEEFEDTKEVIRTRESQNRQYNG
jgi:hypothetical protein